MTHPLRNEAMIREFADAADDPTKDPYRDGKLTPPCIGGHRDLGTARPVEIVREPVRAVKPAPMTPDGEAALAPDRESDDFAVLAAWYSGFQYAEHYRKVVLAQCKEIVRAKFAAKGEKVTEERLKDLSRLHPLYLDYLATHLGGRTKWEHEYRAAGGLT